MFTTARDGEKWRGSPPRPCVPGVLSLLLLLLMMLVILVVLVNLELQLLSVESCGQPAYDFLFSVEARCIAFVCIEKNAEGTYIGTATRLIALDCLYHLMCGKRAQAYVTSVLHVIRTYYRVDPPHPPPHPTSLRHNDVVTTALKVTAKHVVAWMVPKLEIWCFVFLVRDITTYYFPDPFLSLPGTQIRPRSRRRTSVLAFLPAEPRCVSKWR